MARRRKSSEVLISGDKVDPREQRLARRSFADAMPAPPSEDEEFDIVARRPRKRPKVIDARGAGETDEQTWSPEEPGEARGGAEWEGENAGRGAAPQPATDEEQAPSAPAEDWSREEAPAPAPEGPELEDEVRPEPVPDPEPEPGPEPEPVSQPEPEPEPEPKAAAPPPRPAPVAKREPRPKSAKEQGQIMAKAAVGGVVERLRAEAHRKGSLTLADIDAMQGEFTKQVADLTESFEASVEAYVEARERANWDQKRDYPFDRLIVKKFSHLFQEQDLTRFDRVSRRMLPGFFLALGMILGPEIVEEYQEKSRLIVGRVRDELGEGFDWEDAYASDDSAALVLDALVAICLQFEDYERRSTWFEEIVNGHLAPVEDSNRDDAGWEMSPAGVRTFLTALLSDLRKHLANRDLKNALAKRHGAGAVRMMVYVFKQIEG